MSWLFGSRQKPLKVVTVKAVGADPNVLRPSRQDTLALLRHAQAQKVLWATEEERLFHHLRELDTYEATHGGIVQGTKSA
jgi:hypothetical protein